MNILSKNNKTNLGGKAQSLIRLSKICNVPDFFVITNDYDIDINFQKVFDNFDNLKSKIVAVRSSALNEDGKSHSWAGVLTTELNVEKSNVINSIKICRISSRNIIAQAYSQNTNQSSGEVCVIVQKMINSDVSGVAFSRHPVDKDGSIYIEACLGIGELLVSGEITPDSYKVSNGQIIDVYISDQTINMSNDGIKKVGIKKQKNQKLSDNLIFELAEVVMLIEKEFDMPVDIEWAVENKVLYILQARPITTEV